MATRHDDHDGSDIFWPGYVDAVTNLVLNLLFLLTIMTVAVFMFALELGRANRVADNAQAASVKQEAEAMARAAIDPARENIELKREIERLNKTLAQQGIKPGRAIKTVDVSASVPQPQAGLNMALAKDGEVIVRFTADAVAFTPEERERLLTSLKPIVASGKASINVEVPAGFTEAKRMGFYRAMAVRNLLLEMQLPNQQISVAVHETKSNANAALVKVGPY